MNALAIAQSLTRESVTWNSSLNPFKAHIEEGMPHLVVVAGDNGSGKSYFVEWMRGLGAQAPRPAGDHLHLDPGPNRFGLGRHVRHA